MTTERQPHAVRAADPRRTRILSTSVEHHAVLDPLHWLAEAEGAEVELLPVDQRARLRVEALREAVERDPASVALISVMWANNEVGTLQPVEDVVAIAAEHGIPVHTDAVQAVGHVPLGFAASGVDALTLTGHKLGGPYGVGALVVRREVAVSPLVHGGLLAWASTMCRARRSFGGLPGRGRSSRPGGPLSW